MAVMHALSCNCSFFHESLLPIGMVASGARSSWTVTVCNRGSSDRMEEEFSLTKVHSLHRCHGCLLEAQVVAVLDK